MSAYVYKYTDLNDNKVKYIGIVYGQTRKLTDRLIEHEKDYWFDSSDNWLIEYIELDNRSVAESYESHLISFYKTYEYYNICKNNWGVNKFLPEPNWICFDKRLYEIEKKYSKLQSKYSLLKQKYENLIDEIKDYKNALDTGDYSLIKEIVIREVIAERLKEGKAKAKNNNPDFKEGRPKKYSQDELNDAIKKLEDFSYNQVSSMTGISKSTLLRFKKSICQ